MKVTTILKSNNALTNKQGIRIRDRIFKKLYQGKRITVDCGGLIAITSQFLQPIILLLLPYPKDFRNNNIRFTNLSKSHTELIRRNIRNILIQLENDNKNIKRLLP